FIKYGSSPFSIHAEDVKRGFVEIPPWLPTGATPVNYALNWGAFDSHNVLAIHCVHINDEDLEKLKEHDVAIAVCPRCNAQLGMGVPPINEFLRAGMRVGLGTDSPAATDSADMLTEMRIGMLVQRAVNVGEFLNSATMLEMATMGGARALRMDDMIGSLEIGKYADVIAVDLSGSHQTPTTDPVSAVVNTVSGSDVLMTMVAGTILYEKNHWHVDVEVAKNIARVIEIRGKLRG
ncbi:MAG: amidohydrolase family protein, partial [Raoultibacter sp.]